MIMFLKLENIFRHLTLKLQHTVKHKEAQKFFENNVFSQNIIYFEKELFHFSRRADTTFFSKFG